MKGRMFNVHTQHTIEPVDDFIETAAKQVLQIHCAIPARDGDVLVFMPGQLLYLWLKGEADTSGAEEIENCCELLKRAAQDFPDGHMQVCLDGMVQVDIFSCKCFNCIVSSHRHNKPRFSLPPLRIRDGLLLRPILLRLQ